MKIEENELLENVIQEGKDFFELAKGKWREDFFKNDGEVVLEIGCGKGDYTIGLARIFKDKNFIGTDFKGDRVNVGAKAALEERLDNVAFLRVRAEQLRDFFEEGEVHEIWVTFPGPRPKKSEANRRLTNQKFLDIYKYLLGGAGKVSLKTDSEFVFDFTKEMLADRSDVKILVETEDLYDSDFIDEHFGIVTDFEKRFLAKGLAIKYICFEFVNVFGL